MINYQLGKIYKIVGNNKIYVGSTCERLLCQRLSGHIRSYKSYQKGKGDNVTSFQCLTDPDHYIELLELCQCDTKDELHKCERKWIEQLECVNRCIVGRTTKEYREDNNDKIKEQHKKYREDNKEQTKEYNKQYRDKHNEQIKAYQQANKEQIKEYRQEYQQTNKDHINEQQRQRRAKAK